MSFDLHLQHFKEGESSPIDPALVANVLSKYRYQGPDDFGYYIVSFPDGVEVMFSASGLDGSKPFSGCSFNIHGIGSDLVEFVFEVARVGGFVIFNCQGRDTPESPVLILVSPDQEQHLGSLKKVYPNHPVCLSAEMLGELLFEGYEGWKVYRDQAIKDN